MLLSQPMKLPCGLEIQNRLCKAAMAETMAVNHDPDDHFLTAYSNWADGGWGMILTGNVMVSDLYHGSPADVALPSLSSMKNHSQVQLTWKSWAETCQRNGTPTIVQLCHPGKQSAVGCGNRSFFTKTVAPSPIPLNFGTGFIARAASALLFGTPRELTDDEITGTGGIIDQFVNGAKQCFEAGFKGIELHAAHGYLLAEFMSSKSNTRTGTFGGPAAKRVEVVLRIIKGIRAATSKEFCIGIKLNSADVSASGDLKDALDQIRLIVGAGIDFIEISGGTYEDPKMLAFSNESRTTGTLGSKKSSREAFFLEFSQIARKEFPSVILMVTGGFRTRAGMEAALTSGACDIVGIGRPACVLPKLPNEIILNEKEVSDNEATLWLKPVQPPFFAKFIPIKAIGAGIDSKHYAKQIQILGRGGKPIDSRL